MGPDLAPGTSTVTVLCPATARVAVCEVRGEIDISNVMELEHGLADAFDQASAVVVDLAEVTFLASAGVRALFDACGHDRIMAVVTGRRVDTILRICGMSTVVACRPDRDAARCACLAALREPRPAWIPSPRQPLY